MQTTKDPEAVDTDPRQRALQRLRDKRDFRRHLTAYVTVNVFVVTIWALTGAGFPWFLFPLLGWGIGLVFHGLDAYGRDITEAEIEREMERTRAWR